MGSIVIPVFLLKSWASTFITDCKFAAVATFIFCPKAILLKNKPVITKSLNFTLKMIFNVLIIIEYSLNYYCKLLSQYLYSPVQVY